MIVDLQRFLDAENIFWDELERMLEDMESEIDRALSMEEVKRFHYLYQRCATDFAKLDAFPNVRELRDRLESLLSRAYAEIHETREKPHRFSPVNWFFKTFPQTFRRHSGAFMLSVIITLVGVAFGGLALYFDPDSKSVLMPFSHLQVSPKERVKQEESQQKDRLEGHATSFSAYLMTHNTRVSILTMALGITWGIGAILILFSNGVMLGAVCVDYITGGESAFLAGWLLPHGAIEIPSILIAGQAGLVLARALIGAGSSEPVRARLRAISPDLITLIFGVAVLLVWAGIVEAFFSQYHEPVLPYSLKIIFGLSELVLLTIFLSRSGKVSVGKKFEGMPLMHGGA